MITETTTCPFCQQEGDLNDAYGDRCDVCADNAEKAQQEIYDQIVAIRGRIETLKLTEAMDSTYGGLVAICRDLSL